jgi:hypothetical protein
MDYAVGDRVCILPEPPDDELAKDIWVHWIDEMDDYCGQEAFIEEVHSDHEGKFYYRLDADGGKFIWCEECFTDANVSPSVDPELDDAEVFALLTM